LYGKPVTLPVGDKGKIKFKPVILRCAPFYQNFYGFLQSMQEGHLYLPLTDRRLGHVDMEDACKCVAEILANPEPHGGKTYVLIGEYQPGNMLASTVGMKAGIRCSYSDVPDDVAVEALTALGISKWVAENQVAMYQWFREDNGVVQSNDIESILGSKPTKFGAFVASGIKPLIAE
jgi:uncharacterized protein YbjT (DUF2867 family)